MIVTSERYLTRYNAVSLNHIKCIILYNYCPKHGMNRTYKVRLYNTNCNKCHKTHYEKHIYAPGIMAERTFKFRVGIRHQKATIKNTHYKIFPKLISIFLEVILM